MEPLTGQALRIRGLGEICPECKQRNALSVWAAAGMDNWLACDYCDYTEFAGKAGGLA